jgi:hypothetical protein
MANLAKQLAAIRQRYVSLEEMAQALRRHPGFQGLNRATISRWLVKPTRRAALAIAILNSRSAARTRLRIAQTNSLAALPSTVVATDSPGGKGWGLLAQRYGVTASLVICNTGGEAFELLEKGQAEIALGSRDLLPQLGRDCRRLCSLSKTFITGITTQPVEAVTDLRGRVFGFLAGSPFGARLEALARNWGVAVPPPVPLRDTKECADALRAGRIAGMIGTATNTGQVRRAVERHTHLFPMPQGMLGSYELEVAVNLRLAAPAGVRAYLYALQETAEYVNYRKSIETFQAEIAEHARMDRSDVRHILTNSIFGLTSLEPATVLALWEQEVVRK